MEEGKEHPRTLQPRTVSKNYHHEEGGGRQIETGGGKRRGSRKEKAGCARRLKSKAERVEKKT